MGSVQTAMESPTYQLTSARVFLMDRKAIVLDMLGPLGHIAQVSEPHMTLLFRTTGYTQAEVQQVQDFIDREYGKSFPIDFTLYPWGKASDLIHGPLEELAKHVAREFEHWGQDGQYRPPHVKLRDVPRRRHK